jgi:membrane protease YdiL (CAAX protease family)
VPILLCLALILIYPLISVPVQASISALAPKLGMVEARVVTEAAIWLYAAIILAIALLWEGRTLASIGFRKFTFGSLALAIGGAAAMIGAGALASYVVYDLLHQPQHAEAQAAALAAGSVGYAVCLAIRAGVIEEILFRGLAINQLMALTGRRWLSAIIPGVVFVLIHALHFDWIQLVPIAAITVVITILYMWRRNLWANIVAHIIVDALGLITLAMQTHK